MSLLVTILPKQETAYKVQVVVVLVALKSEVVQKQTLSQSRLADDYILCS